MSISGWLMKNTSSLEGKTVALTGSTGGIGRELCFYLASLGADLVLVDRNEKKQNALRDELISEYPSLSVTGVICDLEDISSVKIATDRLIEIGVDVFIHNAGAYSIPRHKCKTGYDNVFEINFVSPYYMIRRLLPMLDQRLGRVVVVGSIAHNYSKRDGDDIDFQSRTRASLVYGNAKRYLMFSLYSLFDGREGATLSVTHPGITFTGITAHYPKVIYAIIKYPMKVIFMRPRRAALSVLRGVFEPTAKCEWIGPRIFSVWGLPKRRRLKTAGEEEIRAISLDAERIYMALTNNE